MHSKAIDMALYALGAVTFALTLAAFLALLFA